MSEQIKTVKVKGAHAFGTGFFANLTLIFITLKLCNVITWSWLWVLAPMLLPLSILAVLFLVLVCIVGFVGAVEAMGKHR